MQKDKLVCSSAMFQLYTLFENLDSQQDKFWFFERQVFG